MNRATRWKRIARFGFTREEADACPMRMPLWMYRIEQEEGMPVRDILADTAATARQTGYTLADLAREWDIDRTTLHHWASKWGIRFPRGASALQRESVSKRNQGAA